MGMSAATYAYEVGRGIRNSADPGDDPGARCTSGGRLAVKETDPQRIPLIREWEYAGGRLLAFTTIDSCLGAIQIVDPRRLVGAHFAMFASGLQYDTPQFCAALAAAEFQINLPILYFGGGVADWRAGLGANPYMTAAVFPFPVQDAAQRRWIFEIDNGVFTYHSMV